VGKSFWRGKERLDVLKDLDLTMKEGSFEALMGPSGSGKSTLLNLIAGLDVPTSGSLKVAGADLSQMSEGDRAGFRAANIGFVFQTYNLMPVLTAVENVELPLLLAKLPAAERRKRAEIALKVVGLEGRMGHYPRQLSGGQEQRVTIARAIVTDPKIIVADEPTGDLDRDSANDILNLLGKLNTEFNKTIVMVTHDPAAAERATICHRLDKGALAL
jgi:putative ABC transport system ATP-binding protein